VANFPGGSAYAMVRDIAAGHYLVTERSFGRLDPPDLDKLRFELDRHLREIRGDQPAIDDVPAVRDRNQRIQRLNTALTILRSYRTRRRT